MASTTSTAWLEAFGALLRVCSDQADTIANLLPASREQAATDGGIAPGFSEEVRQYTRHVRQYTRHVQERSDEVKAKLDAAAKIDAGEPPDIRAEQNAQMAGYLRKLAANMAAANATLERSLRASGQIASNLAAGAMDATDVQRPNRSHDFRQAIQTLEILDSMRSAAENGWHDAVMAGKVKDEKIASLNLQLDVWIQLEAELRNILCAVPTDTLIDTAKKYMAKVQQDHTDAVEDRRSMRAKDAEIARLEAGLLANGVEIRRVGAELEKRLAEMRQIRDILGCGSVQENVAAVRNVVSVSVNTNAAVNAANVQRIRETLGMQLGDQNHVGRVIELVRVAGTITSGVRAIAEERARQIDQQRDGYDDKYNADGMLAVGAAKILIDQHPLHFLGFKAPYLHRMFGLAEKYKGHDSLTRLRVAGALVAAEYDRIARLRASPPRDQTATSHS